MPLNNNEDYGLESFENKEVLEERVRKGEIDFKFDRIVKEFDSSERIPLETFGRFCEAFVSRAERLNKNPHYQDSRTELKQRAELYSKAKEIIDENESEVRNLYDPEQILVLLEACTDVLQFSPNLLKDTNYEVRFLNSDMEGLFRLSTRLLGRLDGVTEETGIVPKHLARIDGVVDIINKQEEKIRKSLAEKAHPTQQVSSLIEKMGASVSIQESKLWDLVETQLTHPEITLVDAGKFAERFYKMADAYNLKKGGNKARKAFDKIDGELCKEISEIVEDRNEISDLTNEEVGKFQKFALLYYKKVSNHVSQKGPPDQSEPSLETLRPFYKFLDKIFTEANMRSLKSNEYDSTTYQDYKKKFDSHTE